MTALQTTTLNNGVEMPLLGFGVFQVPEAAECERVVSEALEAGYRLIDTAAAYGNEEAVGRAIAASGIAPDEIFVTTKLWIQDAGEKATRAAFETSLAKLGLDRLDLYLIHQPFNDYYGSWRALEELLAEGLVRAIGVSNFYPERLVDLALNASIVPAVNQVELHPFFQQADALATMNKLGVAPQAWGPFAEGQHGIFTHPVLTRIGEAHGVTAAQVALRWNIQRGVSVLPKSVTSERIKANADVWAFELSASEMDEVATLDLGHSEIIDHSSPNTVEMLNGLRIHD
ncbi:diketogulonate reductase-like aldo/keto reductase [Luteococcus japonicus]|uniref:Diketogulonate reductase-like aldo/keto reductase n=1 Tax=Luteococcus japonicus TaxID=33984 RepID=A0A3N1ZT71_9ACTN|nr:aldo/keto reductase [Luteococcus japonicus]ROR54073.1 diketogulonate reductase-like aldo/keto reductase [Luteococcus japonicus]